MADLESPDSAEDLYRYRHPGCPRSRPIVQGDVFDEVTIPGLDDGPGLAMVMTHACSMRQGPHLRPRVLMGRVASRPAVRLPWKGHFTLFPLPALQVDHLDANFALSFDELGTVPTTALDVGRRVACLDDFGIALLNQRHAHYFTRYAVETAVLHEQAANVLVEAELLESWRAASIPEDADDWAEQAAVQEERFDAFLAPLREGLKEPSHRAATRRKVNQEIRARFG